MSATIVIVADPHMEFRLVWVGPEDGRPEGRVLKRWKFDARLLAAFDREWAHMRIGQSRAFHFHPAMLGPKIRVSRPRVSRAEFLRRMGCRRVLHPERVA